MSIWFFALLIVLGVLFPRFTKYIIVAPLIGFCAGGLAWAMCAAINNDLINVATASLFAAVGMLLAEAVAVMWPVDVE